jgi:TolA-binding protein
VFERLVGAQPAAPLDALAEFWLAECELRSGKSDRAAERFGRLGATSPGSVPAESWRDTARLRRIQCLVDLRRWPEVVSEADALLTERPEFAQRGEVHLSRGRALQSQPFPKFDDARRAFEAAADAQPDSELAARARFLVGETHLLQKQYAEAVRAFHEVELLHRAPKWQAAALLEAGKAYEAMGKPTDARSSYEKLLREFAGAEGAAEARERLDAMKAPG